MKQLQGLKNFSQNIQPVMLKIKNARDNYKVAKLDIGEQSSILEFYLEVLNYLSKQQEGS